jgi:hypothetical protein
MKTWGWPAMALLCLWLAGCGSAGSVDEALRRVDVLDRVFDPAGRWGNRQPAPPPEPPPRQILVTPAPMPAALPLEQGSAEPEPLPGLDFPARVEPAAAEPRALPAPAPPPPVAALPAAPPPAGADTRTPFMVRTNPWLTQFYGELTPEQQARVQRQLRSGTFAQPERAADPASVWDPMGLADRVRLVFGPGRGTAAGGSGAP